MIDLLRNLQFLFYLLEFAPKKNLVTEPGAVDELRYVDLEVIDQQACLDHYGFSSPTQLCLSVEGGKGSCSVSIHAWHARELDSHHNLRQSFYTSYILISRWPLCRR